MNITAKIMIFLVKMNWHQKWERGVLNACRWEFVFVVKDNNLL